MQHDQPMHRPNEFVIPRTPAHPPGYRQRVERRLHNAGQQRLSGLSFFSRRKRQPLAVRRLLPVEIVDVDAALGSKSERRLGWRPVIVERDADGRTFLNDLAIVLRCRNGLHNDRQASRAGKAPDVTVREPRLIEASLDSIGECRHQRTQCRRRQLFGADLDQQVTRSRHFVLTLSTIGKPSCSRLS